MLLCGGGVNVVARFRRGPEGRQPWGCALVELCGTDSRTCQPVNACSPGPLLPRRQLGPVVRSLHAQRGGLAASLLERLIAHHEQLAPQYATRGLVMPSSEPPDAPQPSLMAGSRLYAIHKCAACR
jgi:hypothetical protein